eukprot:gene26209-biopygen14911
MPIPRGIDSFDSGREHPPRDM